MSGVKKYETVGTSLAPSIGGRPMIAPHLLAPRYQVAVAIADHSRKDKKNILGLGKKERNMVASG
jgi:hypothetical protein